MKSFKKTTIVKVVIMAAVFLSRNAYFSYAFVNNNNNRHLPPLSSSHNNLQNARHGSTSTTRIITSQPTVATRTSNTAMMMASTTVGLGLRPVAGVCTVSAAIGIAASAAVGGVDGTKIVTASLAAVGIKIVTFYKTFPLLAGFLTCATKAGFADSLAQLRDVCTTKFSKRRNLAMVLYSGSILGLVAEVMYNKFFPIMFGTQATMATAIKMTLFDGLINAPFIWLPPAYLAQALVYGYPKRDAIQKYITDVRENGLLTKYWSLWMPMSLLNFSIVPSHFRVAFVAMVSFFWMIILSLVANNTDQDPDSCPVEPEPVLLNPRALD